MLFLAEMIHNLTSSTGDRELHGQITDFSGVQVEDVLVFLIALPPAVVYVYPHRRPSIFDMVLRDQNPNVDQSLGAA
jgi:hypothetical protein